MENKVLHRSSSQPTACAALLPGRFAQKTTWHSFQFPPARPPAELLQVQLKRRVPGYT